MCSIRASKFAMLVNWSPTSWLKSTTGLQQGCTLSPSFFILRHFLIFWGIFWGRRLLTMILQEFPWDWEHPYYTICSLQMIIYSSLKPLLEIASPWLLQWRHIVFPLATWWISENHQLYCLLGSVDYSPSNINLTGASNQNYGLAIHVWL